MKQIKVKVTDASTLPEGTTSGTLKYLGTDKHSRKVLEGKLFSNVMPKNFGRDKRPDSDWFCAREDCIGPHRAYLAKCTKCGERRPF